MRVGSAYDDPPPPPQAPWFGGSVTVAVVATARAATEVTATATATDGTLEHHGRVASLVVSAGETRDVSPIGLLSVSARGCSRRWVGDTAAAVPGLVELAATATGAAGGLIGKSGAVTTVSAVEADRAGAAAGVTAGTAEAATTASATTTTDHDAIGKRVAADADVGRTATPTATGDCGAGHRATVGPTAVGQRTNRNREATDAHMDHVTGSDADVAGHTASVARATGELDARTVGQALVLAGRPAHAGHDRRHAGRHGPVLRSTGVDEGVRSCELRRDSALPAGARQWSDGEDDRRGEEQSGDDRYRPA